jgi:hypothetical protein
MSKNEQEGVIHKVYVSSAPEIFRELKNLNLRPESDKLYIEHSLFNEGECLEGLENDFEFDYEFILDDGYKLIPTWLQKMYQEDAGTLRQLRYSSEGYESDMPDALILVMRTPNHASSGRTVIVVSTQESNGAFARAMFSKATEISSDQLWNRDRYIKATKCFSSLQFVESDNGVSTANPIIST